MPAAYSSTPSTRLRVGVVGATGYTGVELVRLLLTHPNVDLYCLTSRSEAGQRLIDYFPSLRSAFPALTSTAATNSAAEALGQLTFEPLDSPKLQNCDVVFFATPHGVAMSMAPALLERGVRVIDLGADFRLSDAKQFQTWYGLEHTALGWLEQAVYGLVEVNREAIRQAKLVALAGCYPTAVQLALKPFLDPKQTVQSCFDISRIIADCKSGISGAGRKEDISLLLAENHDSFKAYGVSGHRHLPEITQGLNRIAGKPVDMVFTPHLVPMIRGILATMYLPLTAEGLDRITTASASQLLLAYYKNETFIDVLPEGRLPETRFVKGSNRVQIAAVRPKNPDGKPGDCLVVISAIDNLVKGAAGQAVQALNVMFNFPETTALTGIVACP